MQKLKRLLPFGVALVLALFTLGNGNVSTVLASGVCGMLNSPLNGSLRTCQTGAASDENDWKRLPVEMRVSGSECLFTRGAHGRNNGKDVTDDGTKQVVLAFDSNTDATLIELVEGEGDVFSSADAPAAWVAYRKWAKDHADADGWGLYENDLSSGKHCTSAVIPPSAPIVSAPAPAAGPLSCDADDRHFPSGSLGPQMYPFEVSEGCWLVMDASNINDQVGPGFEAKPGPIPANTQKLNEGAGVQGRDLNTTVCRRIRNLDGRHLWNNFLAVFNAGKGNIKLPPGTPMTVDQCAAAGH